MALGSSIGGGRLECFDEGLDFHWCWLVDFLDVETKEAKTPHTGHSGLFLFFGGVLETEGELLG